MSGAKNRHKQKRLESQATAEVHRGLSVFGSRNCDGASSTTSKPASKTLLKYNRNSNVTELRNVSVAHCSLLPNLNVLDLPITRRTTAIGQI